jgi:hypothetical protein
MAKVINITLRDVEANLSVSETTSNVDNDHTVIPRTPRGYDTAFELKSTLSSARFDSLVVNTPRQISLPGWSTSIQEFVCSIDDWDIPGFEGQQDYFLEDYVDFSYVEATGGFASPNEAFGIFEIFSKDFSKVLSESINIFEDLEKPSSSEQSEHSSIAESYQIAFDKTFTESVESSETLSYVLGINFSESNIVIDSDYSLNTDILSNPLELNNTSEVISGHLQDYWADFVELDYVGNTFIISSSLLIPNFLNETNSIYETLFFESGIFPDEISSASETLLFDIGILPDELSSTSEALMFEFDFGVSSDETNVIYETLLFGIGVDPSESNIINETLSFERGVFLEDIGAIYEELFFERGLFLNELEVTSENILIHSQDYILTDAWDPSYTGTTQSS